MLGACLTAPYVEVRTHPPPQQAGVLRVQDAEIVIDSWNFPPCEPQRSEGQESQRYALINDTDQSHSKRKTEPILRLKQTESLNQSLTVFTQILTLELGLYLVQSIT